MSRLMLRAAILAQGGAAAPPVDIGALRQLDTTRRPAGYTLSNGNQTAINTSGGSNYARWVPTARAILPTDGRRYWEVLCPPGGATTYDGYMGVVSAAQREEFNAGLNPITLGSIGWRGTGTLWSSTTADGLPAADRPAHLRRGRCADVRPRSRHRPPLDRQERRLARRSGERGCHLDHRRQPRLLPAGPGTQPGRWRHAALAPLAVQLSPAAGGEGAGL